MKQYIYHGKVFQFADEKVPKGAAIINEQPVEGKGQGKLAKKTDQAEETAQPEETEATEKAEKDKKNKAKGAQTK